MKPLRRLSTLPRLAMKLRLPKLTGLFGATATLFALMASASANSLSVNFSSDREDAAFGAGETAGAPGYETSGWNDIASVLGDGDTAGVTSPFAGQLTDSNGNAIEGATVEWTTANSWNTTNGVSNGDNKLMNGYLDSSSNKPQATVSIARLPSSFTDAGYTVVVYFGSDGNGRTGKVTVEGGETYSFSTFSEQAGDFPAAYVQTTDTGDGEPDANFAVWSGLNSANVNIIVDRGSNNSGIHGFQIIGATPPPPPPAASISVSFSSDREDAAFGAGETAGAPGYETSGWNDIASVLGDGDTAGVTSPFAGQLTDSNGDAIEGATVEWTTANSWNTTNGVSNGDNKLMNGYLDSSANKPQATVSIAGLPSSFTDAGYTVVVYFGSDGNGRTGKVTVEGGETYSFSSFSEQAGDFPAAYVQTTDTGDGEPDANFAVWSGLNSADVNITVDRGSNNSGIHGFQIITDSSTEEPVGDDPKLALSIGTIAFGTTELPLSKTLDISNAGVTQDLVIESITFSGEGADAFSATNPGTIAVGATGQSTVTFTPPSDGDYSAVLEIKSNDPVSPVIRFGVTESDPEGALVWTVGLPGDGWPTNLGTGGGPETIFVQGGGTNDLPGNPASSLDAGQTNDDYYFAGVYTTVLDGGDYEPVGVVEENEIGAEKAFDGDDLSLRYHFNVPNFIGAATPLWVSWDATNLDFINEAADPRRGVEVYFNGTLIAEETLIRPEQLGEINKTPTFLLTDVNGEIGEGFDNYVELRGISYFGDEGGNWLGIDHVSLNAESAEPGPNVFIKSKVGLGRVDPGAQAFSLAISNVGDENTLTVSGVTASGPDADKVTIGDFPATIAPGATAQINYSFEPGRTGDFQFNIDIASDDVDETDKTTTVAVTAAVIDDAGPSAHYSLDEADGASEMLDITGYGRHGTYDGVTLGQDALIPTGTAGGFGGGSHGEILGERLQMTDFTVSMWANPSELTDFQTLFSQGTGSPSFALVFTQTEVSWFNGDEATLSTETSPIAAGTPVHVAATYDSAGPTVTLFVDGVEVARLEGAPELDLNDPEQDSFYIGAFFAGSLPFSGTLDDVQVYNRVLNAGSVKALFDNPGEVNTGSVDVPPAEGGEITDVSRTAAGVSLSLPDGTTYDIQYSTDLENWSNVATDVTGSYEDTDAGRTGNPTGYYRGVVK